MKAGLTIIAVGLIAIGLLSVTAGFARGGFHHWSFAINGEQGSGKLTTEERSVPSFTRIESNLGLNLIVHVGSPQKVTVTIDDNLIDNIRTQVHDGVLEISSRHSFSTDHDATIEITMPAIEAVTSNGSGNVEIHDLKGDKFAYELAGSGNFSANGSIDKLSIEINGSGSADTRLVSAKNVDVSISGSGEARVAAKNSLSVDISGSGSVSYSGNPEHVHQSVSGSGSVERVNSI